jgi:OFA family oxalate/formate antiporter-like MFS transporter
VRRRLADRVYYGWVVAAACFLAAGAMFGTTYSFGVFFPHLLGSFTVPSATLSLVFGVQTVVIYVGAPLVGGIIDRYGPRRIQLLGALLLGGGLASAARATTFPELVLTYGFVTGVGMSITYVVAYATIPRWFERRRGLANGIAASGLGLGLLVISPASSWLIGAYGWRQAYTLLGAGLVVTLLVAVALLADSHEQVGADETVEFPRGRLATDGGGGWREALGDVRGVVFSLPFALTFVGWVFLYSTLYVMVNHVVRYTTQLGVAWAGVAAISAIGIATSLTRIGVGFVSDRLGRTLIFTVCGGVMGLALVGLSLARVPVAILAAAVVFGAGYGGTGGLLASVFADLFGSQRLNTLFGLASGSFAVAGLLAPPLAGAGYDALGTYAPVFVAVGVVGMVGAGFVGAAGRLQGEL